MERYLSLLLTLLSIKVVVDRVILMVMGRGGEGRGEGGREGGRELGEQ